MYRSSDTRTKSLHLRKNIVITCKTLCLRKTYNEVRISEEVLRKNIVAGRKKTEPDHFTRKLKGMTVVRHPFQ